MGLIAKTITIGGVSFSPLSIAGFFGVLAAMLTIMLLKRCRRLRFFYNAPLIFVAVCVLGLGLGGPVWAKTIHQGQTVHMDTTAKDKTETTEDKIKAASIIEQAPIIVDINRRYFKFYGSPSETVTGGILERSQLTNNWNGGRDKLVEAGVYFDVGLTQNFMANVDGGTDEDGLKYTSSLDLWLNLDTAKLTNAWWPGAEIFLHGETRWAGDDDGVWTDAGSAIPPVYDDTMPLAENKFYLSEYYVIQALTPKLSVWLGQLNGAGLIDGNAFANSEKHQFMNTALVDNPAIGPFAPYTGTAVVGTYLPTPQHLFIAAAMDTQGQIDQTVFDTYDTDATTGVLSYGWLPEFGGRPGRYQLVAAYTNKDTTDFNIGSRKDFFEEILGIKKPPSDKNDNYITIGTFDQYLYVKDKERMIGWGLFARYGFTPKDRNVIDQFYSFGLSGRGCLIPGRDLDFWGLGWAGSHISSDLRDDLEFLNQDIDSFEHVIEGFYNIALTPAVHLTLDAQYIINPVVAQIRNDIGRDVESDGHAFLIGTRLQIDF